MVHNSFVGIYEVNFLIPLGQYIIQTKDQVSQV